MTAFLIYMLKVAILSAVFITLYHLLLSRETFHRANRIILVSSLVLSYILPFIVITRHKEGAPVTRIETLQREPSQEPATAPYQPVITSGSVYSSAPDGENAEPVVSQNLSQVIEVTMQENKPEPVVDTRQPIQINWWKVLAAVYLLGLAIALVYRLFCTAKVIGIIRKGDVVEKNNDFTLVQSGQHIHPFSWMRYIVLPKNGKAAGQTPIFDHEKAHLAHHHSLELLWTDILSALQWFNPALMLFRRDLYSIHEFQADADVLRKGYDRRQYQYLLLDCATDKTELRAVNTFRKSTLEGRIDMINRKQSTGSSILKAAYIPVLLLLSLGAFAKTVYDKGIAETIEIDNYVRIDGLWYKFKGNQVRVVSRKTDHDYPEDIVIPDTIIYKNVKYPVTSIGYRAFQYDEKIKSVTIPSTVREIEGGSFYNCTGLEKVVIPSSVKSIGNNAFYGCRSLKSVSIPAAVKKIGDRAFTGTCLESITVQEGNRFYDSRQNCNAIIETSSNTLLYGSASTVIPSTVTTIGQDAFSDNKKLTSIDIPESVTVIGIRAFKGCSGLKSIVIPGTVKRLENSCFENSGIKNLTINGNLETMTYAFVGCNSLETVNYGPKATKIELVSRCPNLKHLFIPATVRQIERLGHNCELELESITVQEGNPVYDSRGGCNAIIHTETNGLILGCANTVIPDDIRYISDYAFTGGHIKELYIPASVRQISTAIFQDYFDALSVFSPDYLRDLKSIVIDPANKYYDSRGGCNAIIQTSTDMLLIACQTTTIPGTVKTIAANAFLNQNGLTELTIPDGVRTITDGAFSYCRNLEKITIGAGVTHVSPFVFSGCNNISEIKVSPGNKTYDSRNDCNAVIETATGTLVLGSAGTVIPDGVTAIGKNAFNSNKKITSIKLPPSVKAIEEYAFGGCSNLEEINLENVTRKGERALDGIALGRYIYADSINGYLQFRLIGKEATLNNVWENAPAKVTIPETFDCKGKTYTVVEIGDGAFNSNKGIESVTIPGTVRVIGKEAFNECSRLKNVTLSNGLKTIQDKAFAYCRNLENIKLPATLEHIGRAAFTRSGLKSLAIPASVTTMGRNITLDCGNLTSLSVNSANKVFDSRKNCNAIIKTDINVLLEGCCKTRIPKGVVAIGPYAFAGATGLRKIKIPSSVLYIFDCAFAFCPLEKVEIPASVVLLHNNPFLGCGKIGAITVNKGNRNYSSPSGSNAIISNGNDIRVIHDSGIGGILNYLGLANYMSRRPQTLILGCRNTVIPQSCSIIGSNSFAFCEGLERLDFPENVEVVEASAFDHCPDLKEIHIPASVKDFYRSYYCPELATITVAPGNRVFDSRDGCNAVIKKDGAVLIMGCRNTVIPSTVWMIESNAFDHVRGLKEITIPNSVERICYDAFRDCADLESVSIPSSVRFIGGSSWEKYGDLSVSQMRNPFTNCTSLKRITVDSDNPVYDSREDCNAVIITSLTTMLAGCSGSFEPESINNVHYSAYETLQDYNLKTDYLSTGYIFADGDLSHSVIDYDTDD